MIQFLDQLAAVNPQMQQSSDGNSSVDGKAELVDAATFSEGTFASLLSENALSENGNVLEIENQENIQYVDPKLLAQLQEQLNVNHQIEGDALIPRAEGDESIQSEISVEEILEPATKKMAEVQSKDIEVQLEKPELVDSDNKVQNGHDFLKQPSSLNRSSLEQQNDFAGLSNPMQPTATLPDEIAEMPDLSRPTFMPNVKQVVETGEQEQKSLSPVVSFLTGNLQAVDPKSIPVMVSSNPFIKEALSANNIEEFMSKPQPVLKLANALGIAIPQDMPQSMSPKEFLKKFGIDGGRVKTELSLLKDNVQLEGLNPYIKRAINLKSKAGTNQIASVERVVDSEKSELSRRPSGPLMKKPDLTLPQVDSKGLTQQNQIISPNASKSLNPQASNMLPKNTQMKMNVPQNNQIAQKNALVSDQGTLERLIADKISQNGQSPVKVQVANMKAPNENASLSQMPLSEDQKLGLDSNIKVTQKQDLPIGSTMARQTPIVDTLSQVDVKMDMTVDTIRREIVDHPAVLKNDGKANFVIQSAEHGPIEVELIVEKNGVDIKINAQSESLREMIREELPKLKESLQLQELELNSFDLNSSGEHQEKFSDFKEFKEKLEQSDFQNSGRTISKISKSTEPMRKHVGQIQVMV